LSIIPGKWSMCGQPYESNGNPADQQIPVDNRIISVISRQAARWIAGPPVVLIPSSPGKPCFIKNRWMNKSNVVNYFRQEAQDKQANLFQPTMRKPPITPMSRCSALFKFSFPLDDAPHGLIMAGCTFHASESRDSKKSMNVIERQNR
jgi:hypothetical protein